MLGKLEEVNEFKDLVLIPTYVRSRSAKPLVTLSQGKQFIFNKSAADMVAEKIGLFPMVNLLYSASADAVVIGFTGDDGSGSRSNPLSRRTRNISVAHIIKTHASHLVGQTLKAEPFIKNIPGVGYCLVVYFHDFK